MGVGGEDGAAGEEGEEAGFVVVGDGDVGFAEDDTVALDGAYAVETDDVGAVYSDEVVGGECLFNAFHAHQGEERLRFAVDEYFDVVFQSFDVEDFAEFDLYQFVFGFNEDALDGGWIGGRIFIGCCS